MMLRSRELVFNKCFHTAGPVWRIKPLSVIFMCSEIYFFFFSFSLKAPVFKIYLSIENVLLETVNRNVQVEEGCSWKDTATTTRAAG